LAFKNRKQVMNPVDLIGRGNFQFSGGPENSAARDKKNGD
jgi:hypothetical protein